MAAQEFEFEYEEQATRMHIASGNYAGYYAREGFFIMNRQNVVGKHNTDGWKIHVSIDDEEDDNNLATAWRIVAEELIREEIYAFKIIGIAKLPMKDIFIDEKGRRVNPNDNSAISQRAKQITIYSGVDLDRDKNWQHVLQNITDRLVASGIRPSYLPQSDKEITGSPYFSYRHERLGDRVEFNVPDGEEDPYADIALELPEESNIKRKQWIVPVPEPVVVEGIEIDEEQPKAPADPADEGRESSYCCGCWRR